MIRELYKNEIHIVSEHMELSSTFLAIKDIYMAAMFRFILSH